MTAEILETEIKVFYIVFFISLLKKMHSFWLLLFIIKLSSQIKILNVLFSRSYIRHEINRIQGKDHDIGFDRINKISLSSYNDKKYINLKMDIGSYHIFINLLVKHIKNNFVKYRQFVLIFTLVKTAIFF